MNFPMNTTVGKGLFQNKSSTGLVQGTAYPDPSATWALRAGILAATATLKMFGGVGITEFIPGGQGNPNAGLGPVIDRATALTGGKPLLGWSVFDQNYAAVNDPSSPVPTSDPSAQVNSYRIGSGARIAVACDPILIDLRGQPLNSQVAWDFENQLLIPYLASGAIASTGSSYSSVTGLVTLATTAPHGLGVGDSVEVSGATGTGGDLALVDGTFTTLEGTGGSTIVYGIATGKTISAITGGAVTTGAALPSTIQILDVQDSNCITVDYNLSTGDATWDYDGSCAVIQI